MTQTPVTAETVRAQLRQVIDPEVGKDLVTLGLIYDIAVEGPRVTVTFTLTTPGCPLQDVMLQAIAASVYAIAGVDDVGLGHPVDVAVGVDDVHTNLVWEPRWHPGMIEDGAWNS